MTVSNSGDPNVSVHAKPEFRLRPPVAIRKRENIGVGYLLAPILSQSADAWTTYEGLKRGFREGNSLLAPIAGRPALLVFGKVGLGFAFALATKLMVDKGYARLARGFSLGAAFCGVIPAAVNISTMRDRR